MNLRHTLYRSFRFMPVIFVVSAVISILETLYYFYFYFLLSWRTALRGIESITLLSLIHAPAFGCGYELKQRN